MPDFDLEDKSSLPKETFPFEIKIFTGERNSIFTNIFKNIGGMKNILNED